MVVVVCLFVLYCFCFCFFQGTAAVYLEQLQQEHCHQEGKAISLVRLPICLYRKLLLISWAGYMDLISLYILGMQWSRYRLHDLLLNCYFFIFQSIFLLTFKSSNQCITARLLQCVALYILWHINIYVYVLHMYIYLYLHDNK